MLILPSVSALSEFRVNKLIHRLNQDNMRVRAVNTQFVHLVTLQGSETSLKAHDREVLNQLLHFNDDLVTNQNDMTFFVTPRQGTVSPWSSKATDIAHNCGLSAIERIERGIVYRISFDSQQRADAWQHIAPYLYDRMTEQVFSNFDDAHILFDHSKPETFATIDILTQGKSALDEANNALGLALADDEVNYLYQGFKDLKRNPSDVELYMFAQANSEHCRHKIFNASWDIDGVTKDKSLFSMIKKTYKETPDYVLSAYKDNAAVMEGSFAGRFYPEPDSRSYEYSPEHIDVLMKVETHNHPTAISPYPGAATGSGGEIRDEGATGRGAKPKAGLVGFSVSNLRIPSRPQPWEKEYGKPDRIVSALDIMVEGPLGGAAFNNEFGRPNLLGYFRSYEQSRDTQDGEVYGYHKPIMLAGGMGNIRREHVQKGDISVGSKLIVLGGPAMNIGLGGGAASSVASGQSSEALDFASVQRENPEMERRCQEVIDACWQLGDSNPIQFIHDVGAGGLSNALPELVSDGNRGGKFNLRAINSAEPGMTPLELWCNESQERYVLAVSVEKLPLFESICQRERAPYAVVGEALEEKTLKLEDGQFNNNPIDMPLDILLGKPPKMHRSVHSTSGEKDKFNGAGLDLQDAVRRILSLPTVAEKTFLITIGDRSVTGLVSRDQMVGPWQVPVADVAVTAASFDSYYGEAMAMGERTPIAAINPAASARMAVGEMLTNINAASIGEMNKIKLSANWMAAAGHDGEDAALYEAVKAVGEELCPSLGLTIPVGKDSMSMKTRWTEGEKDKTVVSPLSLIISGFAPVDDIRKTLTPELISDEDTVLMLVDLGQGKHRLGGSCLAQVYNSFGSQTPDVDSAHLLAGFHRACQSLVQEEIALAYHDRSDGGLFVTLCEMAFAGKTGLDIDLGIVSSDVAEPAAILFSEELGCVLQVRKQDKDKVVQRFANEGIRHVFDIGTLNDDDTIRIGSNDEQWLSEKRTTWRTMWAETTREMQRLRDNPECAEQEHEAKGDAADPGLHANLSYDVNEDIAAPFIATGVKPRVAILREQGVNSQNEMAAAFYRAGFEPVDIHMSDILSGAQTLEDIQVLAACGGFSYGDVLGAGGGWAKSILYNQQASASFRSYFERPDTLSLGICNGCQMLSHLRKLIPGAEDWPSFITNLSERFEARVAMVEVQDSVSLLLDGMAGSRMPIAVSHGEGRVNVDSNQLSKMYSNKQIGLKFVDNYGAVTARYPANPNGSVDGITGLTSTDGRCTIMMPHPERVFRAVANSWRDKSWQEDGPWMRLFRNARKQLG